MIKHLASTKENPIRFFEDFFESGFIKFRESFLGPPKVGSDDLFAKPKKQIDIKALNLKRWTITREEEQAGLKYKGEPRLFLDELAEVLERQKNITLQYIETFVLHNGREAHNYCVTLSKRIDNLINIFLMDPDLSRYGLIHFTLNNISNRLKEYNLPTHSHVPKVLPETDEIKLAVSEKSFHMKDRYYQNIQHLHAVLITEGFIYKKTSLRMFMKAFDGEKLPAKPFIQWAKKSLKGKTISKPVIVHFIQQLYKNYIIEEVSDINLKKIVVRIFLNEENQAISLPQIRTSFSNMRKSKAANAHKNLIDKIIKDFKTKSN